MIGAGSTAHFATATSEKTPVTQWAGAGLLAGVGSLSVNVTKAAISSSALLAGAGSLSAVSSMRFLPTAAFAGAGAMPLAQVHQITNFGVIGDPPPFGGAGHLSITAVNQIITWNVLGDPPPFVGAGSLATVN